MRYYFLVLIRILSESFMTGAFIYLGQQFWIQNHFTLPVWTFMGIALSALFLRGNAVLLGIILGSYCSGTINSLTPLDSLTIALFLAGLVIAIRYISLNTLGPIAPLNNRRVFISWIGILLGCSLVYEVAFSFWLEYRGLSHSFFLKEHIFNVLGMLNGVLCLTPLCLAFDPFAFELLKNKGKKLIFCFILFVITPLAFWWTNATLSIPYALLLMVFSLYFGKIFGFIPTAVGWLCVSTIYIAGTEPNLRLFQIVFTPILSLILLSLFTLSIITSLYIATPHSQPRAPSR